jgi:hypothetical protein
VRDYTLRYLCMSFPWIYLPCIVHVRCILLMLLGFQSSANESGSALATRTYESGKCGETFAHCCRSFRPKP